MKPINKLFRNGLFAGMVLFAFTACSNDDDPGINIFDEDYELVNIKWARMVDDETTCKSFEKTQEIPAVKCAEGYTVSVKDLEGYTQSSQFFSDDPELFCHLAGAIPDTLCIPNEESFFPVGTFFSTTGGPEVPFSLKMYDFSPISFTVNETTSEERFILQELSRIEVYQVSATYRALFKGVSSGNEIEITGKWAGTFYRCKDQLITILPYEEE